MQIIVGLGNPGEKYKNTRHNIGFMAVEQMAAQYGLNWQFNKKFNAEEAKPLARGFASNSILAKPQTFMNNSGQAVQKILSYYKLLPKKLGILQKKDSDLSNTLIIVHDDFDIELGKYKISLDSRSAGHKGVESIINYLKTKNFKRIRIGIRTAMAEKMPAEKFVLQKFSEEEMKIINNLIPEIIAEIK